ncbi:hypothetical protein HZS_7816 [Henneguya salminicola]|nr:hypothetical protein HZS_7816 [Henneguya salminicola]
MARNSRAHAPLMSRGIRASVREARYSRKNTKIKNFVLCCSCTQSPSSPAIHFSACAATAEKEISPQIHTKRVLGAYRFPIITRERYTRSNTPFLHLETTGVDKISFAPKTLYGANPALDYLPIYRKSAQSLNASIDTLSKSIDQLTTIIKTIPQKIEKEISIHLLNSLNESGYRPTDNDISSICPQKSSNTINITYSEASRPNKVHVKTSPKQPNIRVTNLISREDLNRSKTPAKIQIPKREEHTSTLNKSLHIRVTNLSASKITAPSDSLKVKVYSTVPCPSSRDLLGRRIPFRAQDPWCYRPVKQEERYASTIIDQSQMPTGFKFIQDECIIQIPRHDTACKFIGCRSRPACLMNLRRHIRLAHGILNKNIIFECSFCKLFKSSSLQDFEAHKCSNGRIKSSLTFKEVPKVNPRSPNIVVSKLAKTKPTSPDHSLRVENPPKKSKNIKSPTIPATKKNKMNSIAHNTPKKESTNMALSKGKQSLLETLRLITETDSWDDLGKKLGEWQETLRDWADRANINSRSSRPSKYVDPLSKDEELIEEFKSAVKKTHCSNKLSTRLNSLYYSDPAKLFRIVTENEIDTRCTEPPQVIREHYKKIWNKSIPTLETDFPDIPPQFECFLSPLGPKEISKKISEMKINSSAGPDGIFPRTLKFIFDPEELCMYLADPFNRFLREDRIPTCLKKDRTILIPKNSDANSKIIDDFRPISITSTIYRLFAGILADRLIQLAPKILHSMDAS